jgi:hypothetical protein
MQMQQPRHKVQHQTLLAGDRLVALLLLTLPFMQRVWPLRFVAFAIFLAPVVAIIVVTERFPICSCFCLSVCLFLIPSWEPFNPSFFFIIQPSRPLRVSCHFTVSSYSDSNQYNLIDKDISAFSNLNHGFDRGEYMHDMIVSLHHGFPRFLIAASNETERNQPYISQHERC